MKKILVPTDFSNHADNALKVAADLARLYDAEIYLLHILELPMHLADPVSGGSFDSVHEAVFFMKAAHKKFEEVMARDYLKGLNVIETVGSNETKAYLGVLNASKKNDVDMIIMGSHGSHGLEEFLVGSNTEKVVRNSEVPVLVIKKAHENFMVKDFVYATNFDEEDKKNIERAHDFAIKIKANLHLLWINTPNRFKTTLKKRENMDKLLSGMDISHTTLNIFNDLSVEKGIINFSNSINAGLIGIGTHGRKGLAHFINGSLSEDIVNHANIPVITFKI